MLDIYCHSCGGFICDPRHIEYRLAGNAPQRAVPRNSFCSCTPPVVYGPPPGYLSSPGMPRPEHGRP